MTVDGNAALTALKRFGLGPRFGELATIAADPRGFVLSQLDMPEALEIKARLPTTSEAWQELWEFRAKRKRAAQMVGKPEPGEGRAGEDSAMAIEMPERPQTYPAEVLARLRQALATEAPFLERLTGFWANHFCVSTKRSGVLRNIAGAYEREAIRPHVLGRFRDMLQAVVHHPAMLAYLDNSASIGPNSPAGRRRQKGLNENLAREILELHTLGVNGGYTQADVTNFARALTGWSVHGSKSPQAGTFRFVRRAHEPGSFTILGREYDQRGMAQAEAVLDDLASHPSTARHIARKLAVHFVGESAPEELVDHLASTFQETDGNLVALARALVEFDEAWAAEPAKLLPPYDLMVAVHRAVRLDPDDRLVLRTLASLGQPMWGVESPAGWPDEDNAWAAPDAMLERIDWASKVAAAAVGRVAGHVVELARDLLGNTLSEFAQEAIERAESREQALVLLFLSPEFQRR